MIINFNVGKLTVNGELFSEERVDTPPIYFYNSKTGLAVKLSIQEKKWERIKGVMPTQFEVTFSNKESPQGIVVEPEWVVVEYKKIILHRIPYKDGAQVTGVVTYRKYTSDGFLIVESTEDIRWSTISIRLHLSI